MRPLRIAVVSGEASGDLLGASLLRALKDKGLTLDVIGVGGQAMAGEGLVSLFPQNEIAVMGLGPVIRRLPLILRRIRETATKIVEARPDILVTIDAPDFSKRVAKRVHHAAPGIPIVHWVCPSVWAWRPGRAPAMQAYIDHVLCLLPFEPAALERLKGPPGTYIGHPLVEQIPALRPRDEREATAREDIVHPQLLVLPGSRLSEIRRLLPLFLDVLNRLIPVYPGLRPIIPTLPHLVPSIEAILGPWRGRIPLLVNTEAKRAAMRQARAALAASGTVTLELALAGIPMIAAYRVANWEAFIARRLITVSSAILPNIILGENVVPEFIQEDATTENLTAALAPLLTASPGFSKQTESFARLETLMRATGIPPSERAATLVLDLAAKAREGSGDEQARN
ncbi:MAG TPA: lipid-A-disaccharide synthase [Rhabdaerophilum sp.]|nr:lipid-A-disaccharide synthase [Rhabdaerophilum sp.]